jgi:hypothetical protein
VAVRSCGRAEMAEPVRIGEFRDADDTIERLSNVKVFRPEAYDMAAPSEQDFDRHEDSQRDPDSVARTLHQTK